MLNAKMRTKMGLCYSFIYVIFREYLKYMYVGKREITVNFTKQKKKRKI